MARPRAVASAPSALVEIGLPSLRRRGGRIAEEWIERRSGPRKYKRLREIAETDSTVGGYLNVLQFFLGRVKWRVEPAKNENGEVSPEAQAMADRVLGAWEDMEDPPSEIDAEIILHAARDGCAPMEVTLKIPRGPDDPDPMFRSDFDQSDGLRFAWRSWSIRPLESVIEWVYDRSRLVAMVQQPEEDYSTRRIPIDKLLLFRFRATKRSPEGQSLLMPIERDVYFKQLLEEIQAIGAKRDLCGIPVARVPIDIMHPGASAEKRAALEAVKEQMQLIEQDALACLILPAAEDANGKTGWDASLMASGGSRQVDLDSVIRRLRAQIAAGLGGGFMYTGVDGSSARSLDESKQDAFKLSCETILTTLKQVKDVATVNLMRINGIPRALWPTFEYDPIDKLTLAEFASAMQAYSAAGGQVTDAMERELARRMNVEDEAPTAAIEPDSAVEPVALDDDPEPPADLITEPAVRSRFAIGRRALAKLVDAGDLRMWRVAGRRKYHPADIEAYLARSQHQVVRAGDDDQ